MVSVTHNNSLIAAYTEAQKRVKENIDKRDDAVFHRIIATIEKALGTHNSVEKTVDIRLDFEGVTPEILNDVHSKLDTYSIVSRHYCSEDYTNPYSIVIILLI